MTRRGNIDTLLYAIRTRPGLTAQFWIYRASMDFGVTREKAIDYMRTLETTGKIKIDQHNCVSIKPVSTVVKILKV